MTDSQELKEARTPAWSRLKQVRDFSYVFRQGARFHAPTVSLFVVKTKRDEARLGVTVKRKLVGSVGRNQLKRWLREAARTEGQTRRIGIDVILLAKNPPTEITSQMLRQDVAELFRKARIIE